MKHSQLLVLLATAFALVTLVVNINFISVTNNGSNDAKNQLLQKPSGISISGAKQYFTVAKQEVTTDEEEHTKNDKDSNNKKEEEDDDDDDDDDDDSPKVNNRDDDDDDASNDETDSDETDGDENALTPNKDESKTTTDSRIEKLTTETPPTEDMPEPTKTKATEEEGGDLATVEQHKNESVDPIHVVLPPSEIEWIRKRTELFLDFYDSNVENFNRHQRSEEAQTDPERFYYNETTGFTKYQEDKEGPWLDFMIAGHPKTGTTTLVANLANIAPMKIKDFCTSTMNGLLRYIYIKWPRDFPEIMEKPDQYIPDRTLQFRGAKCPRFLSDASLLLTYGYAYPKTKLIIGIRHPVLWLTSFINMGHVGNLYSRMSLCPHYNKIDPITGVPLGYRSNDPSHETCMGECRCGLPICFHRARLHLPLARVGKTPLATKEERDLLSPGDPDGGDNMFNGRLRNPIFVYEQTQMKEDSYWDELAAFLGVSHIPNAHYRAAHGKGHNKTLCIEYYDEYRARLMAHSYNMSVWLENYFLPVATDPDRPDVVVPNPESLRAAVESYKHDPCGRLIRRESDGEYILDPSLGEVQEDGVTPAVVKVHSAGVQMCTPTYPLTPEQQAKRKATREQERQKELAEKNGAGQQADATGGNRRRRGKQSKVQEFMEI